MSHQPLVSVVTSVYDGETYLERSLESVLSQQGVDLELVVVNDGSRDRSGEILREMAGRDSRMRVIEQENRGLTKALERGCAESRGELIARHDADDLSLPGRLARQAELLRSDPSLAFVSCRTLFIGPGDEPLYETPAPASAAEAAAALREGRGSPIHGSVMFRARAYEAAGGYRGQFRYAQDWDLWLRLLELGSLRFLPDSRYAFRITGSSITARKKPLQEALRSLALACREARAAGRPETELLRRASEVSAGPSREGGAGDIDYFLGRCLLARYDRRSRQYFVRSLRRRPWQVRSLFGLIASLVPPPPRAEETPAP